MAEGKHWFTFRKPEDPVLAAGARLETVHEAYDQVYAAYARLTVASPPEFRKRLEERGDSLEEIYKRFKNEGGKDASKESLSLKADESIVFERDIEEHEKAMFELYGVDPSLRRNPGLLEAEYPAFFLYQQSLKRLMDALVAFEDSVKKIRKRELTGS